MKRARARHDSYPRDGEEQSMSVLRISRHSMPEEGEK
jgi:hypothetical protein